MKMDLRRICLCDREEKIEEPKTKALDVFPGKWREMDSEASRVEASGSKNILINDLASFSATITSWLGVEAWVGEEKNIVRPACFVTLY
jgi:hypothetical protein